MGLGARWRRWGRAAIAVAALYALLLGGILPRAAAAPGLDGIGILCTHDGPVSPEGDRQAHDHRGCCTAGALPAAVPPPASAWVAVRWPAGIAYAAARAEAGLGRTGPPVRSTSPRGPPPA